jgi:hypothetical protein
MNSLFLIKMSRCEESKNIEGGLKFNFGWSPESEWNKYQQDFAPIFLHTINIKINNKTF